MRFTEFGKRAGEVVMLSPSLIKVEVGHNPRNFDTDDAREHIANLKLSIREQGVLQPLLVRMDEQNIVLVDGESRLRATLALIEDGTEIVAIPARLVKADNEANRVLLALTANTGKPLTKWEVGRAYKRLEGYGWSYEAIGNKVGQSARYVRESIELSESPHDVQEMLSVGIITPRVALNAVRANGSSAASVLKDQVAKAMADGKAIVKAPRLTKEQEFVKIVSKIQANCKADFENNKLLPEDEQFEHIPVQANLLERLFELL